MSCVSIDPDPFEVSGDQSGLCTVCQRLDLPRLTGSQCSRGHDEGHFHLGPLRNIIAKQFCPGCRLIATAVSNLNLDNEKPETINVTMQLRFPRTLCEEQPENEKGLAVASESSLIEILIDHTQLGRRSFRESAGAIVRSAPGQPAQSIDDDGVALPGGRIVSQDMDMIKIKSWIQTCEVGHSRCRAESDRVKILGHSIRLIDVQNFRVVEQSLAEKYAALSYVWGSDTKPTLNSENLGQLSSPHGLQGTIIPQTIADAIYLVKQLGISYLWVDSICIIQDDDLDKCRQLPIMDEVYQQAYLVVVAATGNDAHAGLPGTTKPRVRLSQQSETIGGIDFTTSSIALAQALENSKWATRGWTFLEGLLSRRALVITDTMTYWDCWESNGREDRVDDESKSILDWNKTDAEFTWRMDFVWGMDSPIIWRTEENRLLTPCRTLLYCEHVTAFQRRELGNQSDALWAFLGILKLQRIRFQKGFIWALPYERLDATLLWSANSGCTCMHTREVEQQIPVGRVVHKLSYPSWSWLSSDTPVQFLDPCGGSVISKVEWLDPIGYEDARYTTGFHTAEATDRTSDADTPSKVVTPDWLSGVDAVDFGLLHLTAQTAHLLVRWRTYESAQWSYATIYSFDGEEIGHLWINSSVARLQGERRTRQAPTSGQSHHSDEVSDDESPESGTTGLGDESGDRIDSDQEEGAGESREYYGQDSAQGIPDDQQSGGESSDCPGEEAEYVCEFLLLSANAREQSDETCVMVEGGLDCGSIKHIDGCEHIQSYNIMLIEWSGGVAYRQGLGIIGKDEWERNAETQKKTIILG